jgi:hypothetical protein
MTRREFITSVTAAPAAARARPMLENLPAPREGRPRRKRTTRAAVARPMGEQGATARRAPEKGRGLSALSRDWYAPGHVSPAAGLMDLRCRM